MEDDFEEEKDIDDNDSEADSVDSYDRKLENLMYENLMYDASEVMELDNCAEGNEGIVQFDFQVGWQKKIKILGIKVSGTILT